MILAPEWKAAVPVLAFRTLLIVIWLLVAVVTLWASIQMGLRAGAETFFSDLRHPWRAQFYSDLEAHLVLVAGWILYRERSRGAGIVFAIAAMLLGALFTLPYILIASVRSASPEEFLLGAGASR